MALQQAACDIRYAERQPYDLVVGRAGTTFLLEIKNRSGKNKLTASQIEFQKHWRGHYAIVRTVGEALQAVGLV